MQPGRTPSWNVIADLEKSAWLEAVELSSDDRLLMPIVLRKRVDWGAPKSSIALLATIGSGGEITIKPLDQAQGEMAALQAVLNAARPQVRSSLALTAMAIYFQVSLQPDGRLRLPSTLADHLRDPPGRRIWIGAYNNDVTLWSEKAWASLVRRDSVVLRQAIATAREAVEKEGVSSPS